MAKDNQEEEQDFPAPDVKENKDAKDSKKTKASSEQELPKEVLILSHHVLSLRMPGQDIAVTKSFREGDIVSEPSLIKSLLEAGALIRTLS